MAVRMRSPVPVLTMLLASAMVLAGAGSGNVTAQEVRRGTSSQQGTTMKIRIDVEGTAITATLDDNEAAKDFVSLLPLTLTLKDYAATEKISDLPKRLSTKGAPAGFKPSVGDVTFYEPWGNLAIFHKDFSYSSGLVKLGKIDSSIETLRRPGPLKATIHLISE